MKVEYYEPSDSPIAVEAPADTRVVMVTGLRPGEPVFVLRAQDAIAMSLLNQYRTQTEGLFEDERALALEEDIQKWIDWRRANRELVRDHD